MIDKEFRFVCYMLQRGILRTQCFLVERPHISKYNMRKGRIQIDLRTRCQENVDESMSTNRISIGEKYLCFHSI